MTHAAKNNAIVRTAMLGSALILAYQVAGKAARDALFLTGFGPEHLPAMIVSSAVIAILLGILNARVLTTFAPRSVMPAVITISAVLQAIEWYLFADFPRWMAVAVYVHVVSLGAVITSGFWSVVNEQLDPYTAKHNFGRITAAGTAGGMAGGLAAERVAVFSTTESVLLYLCVAQILTAMVLNRLPQHAGALPRSTVRARDIFRRSDYMRSLALLVLVGTFSAALLDYVLKVEARMSLGPGEPLLRFFAWFYTANAVLSFLVQSTVTRSVMNRWGPASAAAFLPASMAGGAALALLSGTFGAIVIARAMEAVARSSLFRAGYELFYAPMRRAEKRSLKSINDVTVDRLGDALGGGFAQAVVLFASAQAAAPIMLTAAAATSVFAWFLTGRLSRGYVQTLERSLSRHAGRSAIKKSSTVRAASTPATSLPETRIPDKFCNSSIPAPEELPPASAAQWSIILSADPQRVTEALIDGPPLHRWMIPHVVPLLRRRALAEQAARALGRAATENAGQLADFLLDASTRITIRRALPAIIGCASGPRATAALVKGLQDPDFLVRLACSRALDELRHRTDTEHEREGIFAAVRAELHKAVQEQGSRPNLEYLASLLGAVLPREPIEAAFEALAGGSPHLRGTALEYLESALPPDVAAMLLPVVQTAHEPSSVSRDPAPR